MLSRNKDQHRRAHQAAKAKRASRRRYVPVIVLLASVVLLAIVWRIYEQQNPAAAQPSSTPKTIASPVGKYDWDREQWLAKATAKASADSMFGKGALALQITSGGNASIARRSPAGQLEQPQSGSWWTDTDGLHLEFGEVKLSNGQITEAGIELQAPELGQLVFVRRSETTPR